MQVKQGVSSSIDLCQGAGIRMHENEIVVN